jgi:hypothetical protein
VGIQGRHDEVLFKGSILVNFTDFHTHRFLAAEEELTMPYQFGVYDLLVLPPSFPYGGMVRSLICVPVQALINTQGKCMFDICHAKLVHLTYQCASLTKDQLC